MNPTARLGVLTPSSNTALEPLTSAIVASVPMGRPGHAHEVAGCVLFLASDLASYITGIANVGERMLILMDIQALMSSADMGLIEGGHGD